MSRPLFDPGLQPERNKLAWHRTLLALTVGAILAIRVLPVRIGQWAYLLAAIALFGGTLLAVAAHRRSNATDEALAARTHLPGSGVMLALCSIVALLALTSAVALLS